MYKQIYVYVYKNFILPLVHYNGCNNDPVGEKAVRERIKYLVHTSHSARSWFSLTTDKMHTIGRKHYSVI
jgi:hypothetical protein